MSGCLQCGEQFEPKSRHPNQEFCSKKCGYRFWYHNRKGKDKVATRNKRQDVIEYMRLQSRLYKARHPDKIANYDDDYRDRRNKRISEQSDGTAGGFIAKLMKLEHCQYCGHRFASQAEKRIDHRDPVARGGQHSAANLELCCEPCNLKKAATTFVDWVATLPEPHRSKAVTRAEKARGAPLMQEALPLFGGAVIRQKKDKGIDPVLAKREAIAAWKQWIYELAPSEWLDGYYAATGKPWTDHRLTKATAFYVHYKADRSFARRWNDRRNARRKQQRRIRNNSNVINILGSLLQCSGRDI